LDLAAPAGRQYQLNSREAVLAPCDIILEERAMKAILKDHQVAASDDVVSVGGYEYFPSASVRLDWLEKSPKTAHDLECPHSVQFYDVVIDGQRHVRNAWSYEAPQPKMEAVRDRFGFWEDVQVG
jgi:uncharacterized protein (DUF427 family)